MDSTALLCSVANDLADCVCICQSVCLSVYLSVCLSVCLISCLTVRLSLSLSVRLTTYLLVMYCLVLWIDYTNEVGARFRLYEDWTTGKTKSEISEI